MLAGCLSGHWRCTPGPLIHRRLRGAVWQSLQSAFDRRNPIASRTLARRVQHGMRRMAKPYNLPIHHVADLVEYLLRHVADK